MKQAAQAAQDSHIKKLLEHSEELINRTRQLNEKSAIQSEQVTALRELSDKIISRHRQMIEEIEKIDFEFRTSHRSFSLKL